jgi:hypothetical protein
MNLITKIDMNILEKEIIEVLKEFRDDYVVYEIKAEFEAE